eukprot:m.111897 g.111897  ORF g.111897 m.111897 type:complete len:58 (+) comp9383_c0_seq6:52-225(+)
MRVRGLKESASTTTTQLKSDFLAGDTRGLPPAASSSSLPSSPSAAGAAASAGAASAS